MPVNVEDLLSRLRKAFPERQLPPVRSPWAEPIQLGSFFGDDVLLRVIDTRGAGWIAPRFEGRVEPSEEGARLVGAVNYDPSTLVLAWLIAVAFCVVTFSLFANVLNSVLLALAVTLALSGVIGGFVYVVQKGLQRTLVQAVSKTVEDLTDLPRST